VTGTDPRNEKKEKKCTNTSNPSSAAYREVQREEYNR
jgi:hypothetical protein